MFNIQWFLLQLPLANFLTSFRTSNAAGQAIVVILLIGSAYAWSVLITKHMELKRARTESSRFLAAYRIESRPTALMAKRARFPGAPAFAIYRGVCEALASMSEGDAILSGAGKLSVLQVDTLHKMADQVLAEQVFMLEKNMGVLATAVTAAPFLGLLGTVWGVMDAFGGLAIARTATLSAVAPGVSGALLTTVVGLVVALPSAIGYNVLTWSIRKLSMDMERFTQDLLLDIEKHWGR